MLLIDSCFLRLLIHTRYFVPGGHVADLVKDPIELKVKKFLELLDEMFGTSEEPKPASSCYSGEHFWWNSRDEPYLRCAYSFPGMAEEPYHRGRERMSDCPRRCFAVNVLVVNYC